MPKLTRKLIEAIEPVPGTEVFVWDTGLPSFGVRCSRKGRKTYIIRYRTPQGDSRKMTIGRVVDFKDPDDARELARQKFEVLRRGGNPKADTRPIRLRDFVVRYRAEYLINLKPRTRETYEELLEYYILPRLGDLPMKEIRRGDVIAMHTKVSAAGPKIRANRAVTLVGTLYNIAIDWEVIPDDTPNPALRIKKHKEKARKRALRPEELPRFWTAVQSCRVWQVQALALLLLFTGARKNEILKARKEWIRWNERILALPDSKTGEKPIMLSAAALEVLARIAKPGEKGWLIPSPRKKDAAFVGVYKPWNEVLEAAGIEDFTYHDIRHTVGTYANKAEVPLPGIAKILTHASLKATERYVQTFSTQDFDYFEKSIALIQEHTKDNKNEQREQSLPDGKADERP